MAKDFKPRMKPTMKKPAGKKRSRKKHAGKKKAVRPGRGERPTKQPREATPQGPATDPSPLVEPGPAKSHIANTAEAIRTVAAGIRIAEALPACWEWITPFFQR